MKNPIQCAIIGYGYMGEVRRMIIEQNRKVCDFIRSSIYRGVVGTIRFMWGQAATPYPAETNDPSLGMPTIIMQCQDYTKDVTIIGPDPYAEGDWMTPPWLK